MTIGEVGIRETQFHARIDDLVAIALASGSSTFEGLLRSLPGVWPVDALAALKRLEDAGRLLASIAVQLAQEAGSATYPVPAYSDLPVPHPLDFEWRFTSGTSRMLLSIADELAPKPYGLLLYGTPGVASHAISHSLQRKIIFVAEDNPVTRRLAEANTLRRAPISIELCQRAKYFEEAGGVILDPPWYDDYIRPMLRAASAACRVGGVVVISLPPEGTRDTAHRDRRRVVAYANRIGLDLASSLPLRAEYETPFFERNALRAEGLSAPPVWRRGDVLVFRKSRSITPASMGRRKARGSTEFTIGRMRVFLRAAEDPWTGQSDDLLRQIVPGDILPTVTRRDPRRRSATVFTSGNRIFASPDSRRIALAAAIAGKGDINSSLHGIPAGDRYAIERATYALTQLADIEATEEAESAATGVHLGSRLRWAG